MTRLAWLAAAVVLALAAALGVQAVNVFAAMQAAPAVVGGCGSSGDVRTTAACYRVGREAAAIQRETFRMRRSAAWSVVCPSTGPCTFTMDFRRQHRATVHCDGTATVKGRSGDWRKRRVTLAYTCR